MAGKSGWLSIYFGGLRFPVPVPYECAVALFSGEQVAAARAYGNEHLSYTCRVMGRQEVTPFAMLRLDDWELILESLDGGTTSFVGESEVEAVADAGAVAHLAR